MRYRTESSLIPEEIPDPQGKAVIQRLASLELQRHRLFVSVNTFNWSRKP
ncbi:hypothetical protein [Cesiribacter sp. SM1]|nr:hypothetical protein [Cesiribacter sp. SM1]